jgi:hypothetical protein
LSQFDLATFAKLATPFRFRRPNVTFATNSIKLRFSLSNGRPDRYVWIDPPWDLLRNDQLFLDSSTYPNPHSVAGRHREGTWLRKASWFRPGAFLALSREPGQLVGFRFVNGWSILAPASAAARDVGQWYDDWYIAESQAPPNKSLERTREG